MNEFVDEALIDVWVPGAYLPGDDSYCPIVPWQAHPSNDPTTALIVDSNGQPVEIPRHRLIYNPGFLILELGPIFAEETISKAAEATAKSLDSLFAACSPNVHHHRVATAVELEDLMRRCGHLWSHIIIIGHGTEEGFCFLDRNGFLNGTDLANLLGCHDDDGRQRQILSLCCHSGCENISRALSNAANVTEVIAPTKTFDLRWAVVFVTGYLLKLFGTTGPVEQAVKEAAEWSAGSEMPIAVWRDGIQIL